MLEVYLFYSGEMLNGIVEPWPVALDAISSSRDHFSMVKAETRAAKKVAILGGGMGALSAAWQLVHRETEEFEVTVYQRDFVLGGKGSSTRNPAQSHGRRIEEHGIHILMGWYRQSVSLLREVYDVVGQDSLRDNLGKLRKFEDVLTGYSLASMSEHPELTGADWQFFTVEFPERAGHPRDGGKDREVPELMGGLLSWITFFLRKLVREFDLLDPHDTPEASQPDWWDGAESFLGASPSEPGVTELRDASTLLVSLERETVRRSFLSLVGKLMQRALDRLLKMSPETPEHPKLRRLLLTLWFGVALLNGLLRARVTDTGDFDKLNSFEFKDWLLSSSPIDLQNPRLMADSPVVEILYDLSFGHGKPFAAGVWAYASLLFALGYAGHYTYKMNGGMGDVVFAPLYLALKEKGVKFCFGHEVTRLVPDKTGSLSSIVFQTRAMGAEGHAPLVPVRVVGHGDTPCWQPSPPFGSDEEYGRLELEAGVAFDSVVLGIAVGGLFNLIDRAAPWPDKFLRALDSASTVATRAAQIWTTKTQAELGWLASSDLVATFVRPFNSCVDMSHTLGSEPWPQPRPKSVIYFCDQAPDNSTQASVKEDLSKFLENNFSLLASKFDWTDLVDPDNGVGKARVDSQYFRANAVGSDRYVLTPPGSLEFRLRPGDSGLNNLYLAGDWVDTEINAGCLESATRAGIAAGRALAGHGPTHSQAPNPGPSAYVDLHTDWSLAGPIQVTGAKVDLFTPRVPRQKLEQFCTEYVNSASGGMLRAEPLGARVLLLFADIPEARSAPNAELGYLEERECSIFVPIWLEHAGTRRPALLAPAVFVDNFAAVVAGREVFGLPKQIAEVNIGRVQGEYRVLATALRKAGKDSVVEPHVELIKVTRSGFRLPFPRIPSSMAEMFSLAFPGVTHSKLLENGIDLVCPRQLRATASQAHAVHKEWVRSTLKLKAFRQPQLVAGPFELEFPSVDLPRFASSLGLVGLARVAGQLTATVDFTLETKGSI